MINAVLEGFFGLFGQIDITAHIGVFKAKLADLTFGRLFPFLIDQDYITFDLGLTDRAGLIRLVDFENTYRESALGRGVNIDKVKVFVVYVVCGLTSDKQHPQKRTCLVAEHTDIRGRQEGDRYAFFNKEHLERHRVFDGGVADDKNLSAANTERLQNNDYRGDKVHRSKQGYPVLAVKGSLSVDLDRFDRSVKVAVLMEYALGITGRARGINCVCRVVVVRGDISALGLDCHNIFPVLRRELGLTSAVLADEVDPFGRIGILDKRPRRAGFPNAYHGDDRHNSARKIDKDKILFAYTFFGKIRVNTSAEIVKLSVSNALWTCFIKQYRIVRVFFGIVFKHLKDSHYYSPFSNERISSNPVTSKTSQTASLTLTSFIPSFAIIFL